jgi:predicted component of type VI protein secretion system
MFASTAFVSANFSPPAPPTSDRFQMRILTIHDVVKDFDAVMSSREDLWQRFGQLWGWPGADLTLEQNLIDLGWHQKESQTHRSFAYTVLSPDEARVLGCVYIEPPYQPGFDATVLYWVRSSELASGLEQELGSAVRDWVAAQWPFKAVDYPGR